MPIYEYICTKCDHEMDIMQKISESALTNCPKCRTDNLKKMMSAPSFRLKGTGWYETDFKNSGSKPKNDSADKPQSNTTKPDTTKKTNSTE